MSAATGQLSEEDLRELARLVRVIHTDAEAWRERERQEDQARQGTESGDGDG